MNQTAETVELHFPLSFNVAGVTFENRLEKIGKYAGSKSTYLLEREPDNRFDANAIKVSQKFKKSGKKITLGYVPKTLARDLAPMMDDGHDFKLTFQVKFVDGATGECKGIRMQIKPEK